MKIKTEIQKKLQKTWKPMGAAAAGCHLVQHLVQLLMNFMVLEILMIIIINHCTGINVL